MPSFGVGELSAINGIAGRFFFKNLERRKITFNCRCIFRDGAHTPYCGGAEHDSAEDEADVTPYSW